MSSKNIFILFTFLLAFASCRNNNNYKIKASYNISQTRLVGSDGRRIIDTIISSQGLTTYSYDSAGRVTNVSSESDGGARKNAIYYTYYPDGKLKERVYGGEQYQYTYLNNLVICTIKTDSETRITTSFQNKSGFVDSSFTTVNDVLTDAGSYIYDSSGMVMEQRIYQMDKKDNIVYLWSVCKFTYENENLVSEANIRVHKMSIEIVDPVTHQKDTISDPGDYQSNWEYEYYPDKLNTFRKKNKAIDPINVSKNLVKTATLTTLPANVISRDNYRYLFDNKGRVVARIKERNKDFGGLKEYNYDSTGYTYY